MKKFIMPLDHNAIDHCMARLKEGAKSWERAGIIPLDHCPNWRRGVGKHLWGRAITIFRAAPTTDL